MATRIDTTFDDDDDDFDDDLDALLSDSFVGPAANEQTNVSSREVAAAAAAAKVEEDDQEADTKSIPKNNPSGSSSNHQSNSNGKNTSEDDENNTPSLSKYDKTVDTNTTTATTTATTNVHVIHPSPPSKKTQSTIYNTVKQTKTTKNAQRMTLNVSSSSSADKSVPGQHRQTTTTISDDTAAKLSKQKDLSDSTTTTQAVPFTPISRAAARGASETAENTCIRQESGEPKSYENINKRDTQGGDDHDDDDDDASVLSMKSIISASKKLDQTFIDTKRKDVNIPIVSIPPNFMTTHTARHATGDKVTVEDDYHDDDLNDKQDDDSLLAQLLSDEPLPVIIGKPKLSTPGQRRAGGTVVSTDDSSALGRGGASSVAGFSIQTAPVGNFTHSFLDTQFPTPPGAFVHTNNTNHRGVAKRMGTTTTLTTKTPSTLAKYGLITSAVQDNRITNHRTRTYHQPRKPQQRISSRTVKRRATALELKIGPENVKKMHTPSTTQRRLTYLPPEEVLPKKIAPEALADKLHMLVSPKAENPIIKDKQALAAAKLERRLNYQLPAGVFRPKLASGRGDAESVASSRKSSDSVFERLYRREKRPSPNKRRSAGQASTSTRSRLDSDGSSVSSKESLKQTKATSCTNTKHPSPKTGSAGPPAHDGDKNKPHHHHHHHHHHDPDGTTTTKKQMDESPPPAAAKTEDTAAALSSVAASTTTNNNQIKNCPVNDLLDTWNSPDRKFAFEKIMENQAQQEQEKQQEQETATVENEDDKTTKVEPTSIIIVETVSADSTECSNAHADVYPLQSPVTDVKDEKVVEPPSITSTLSADSSCKTNCSDVNHTVLLPTLAESRSLDENTPIPGFEVRNPFDELPTTATKITMTEEEAALCIQKAWKRTVARSNYRTFTNSASRIQALARARMARAMFAHDRVLLIRAHAFAQACKRLEKIQTAVRLIQFHVRKYLAAKRQQKRTAAAAAVCIQKQWRRHVAQSSKKNVVVVQQQQQQKVMAQSQSLGDEDVTLGTKQASSQESQQTIGGIAAKPFNTSDRRLAAAPLARMRSEKETASSAATATASAAVERPVGRGAVESQATSAAATTPQAPPSKEKRKTWKWGIFRRRKKKQ